MSVEEYINMVPEDIRDIFKSLGDDIRLAIMIDLLFFQKGKTFTQLKDDLELHQGTLNYHLKNLFENGLIINELKKTSNTREYSYYLPTNMGIAFFEKMLEFTEEPLRYHTVDIEMPEAEKPVAIPPTDKDTMTTSTQNQRQLTAIT